MANRAVKQPNGLYARFSDIVDDFTHVNCSRQEMWDFYRDEAGVECADRKLNEADKHPERFENELEWIEMIHGKERADECRKLTRKN